MSSQLPDRPNLEHLKAQAKDLLKAHRNGDPDALAVFTEFVPSHPGTPALHDAQSAIARQYGFPSWAKLSDHVEEMNSKWGITQEVAEKFVRAAVSEGVSQCVRLLELYPGLPTFNLQCALVSGQVAMVSDALTRDPAMVSQKMEPLDWLPLEYVSYSHLHQIRPEMFQGLEACAKLLLDAGADPNASHKWTEEEYSPLSVLFGASSESGHLGIVKLLLEKGANPNDGESVFHSAEHNRPDILEALVEHGADISDRQEPWGNTPIYFLAGYRPTDQGFQTVLAGIKWLLEHGADPNVGCQETNETALHCACRSGGNELVTLLLQHGADPNRKRADGRTPYPLALLTGNAYAIQALVQAGADQTLLPIDQQLADLISGKGSSDPNLKSSREAGYVMGKLGEFGRESELEAMFKACCSPNMPAESGGTALHFAAYTGRRSTIQLILRYHPDLETKDNDFNATPLGWALHAFIVQPSPTGDYLGIIKDLLSAGANRQDIVNTLDWDETPEEKRQLLQGLLDGTA
jgi:ankyrin repeat protein